MRIQITPGPAPESRSLRPEQGESLSSFFRKLGKKGGSDCQIRLDQLGLTSEELIQAVEHGVCGLYDGAYRFKKEALKGLNRKEIYESRDSLADYGETCYTLVVGNSGAIESRENRYTGISDEMWKQILFRGKNMGKCRGYARTLGNLPNNYLRTEDLVRYAENLAENLGVFCRTLRNRELEELNCGGLLAVNQGSNREAAMVILQYEGLPGGELIALVGKGLMFDSGGYHLKPMEGMSGMKFDMCGAAGVLEAFEILVRNKVKKNLMVILTLAENVISSDAVKMGDVITTLAGKTVEIYNTDAEGRLVLCDGITYAQQQKAAFVLDMATLTYSAHAALGDSFTGLFVNDEDLLNPWMEAARESKEMFWRLPLDSYYHKLLEWSTVADFANYAPGKGAGASVAACFLEKFVKPGTRWIHLDMVGPSVIRSETEEMREGASGAGIITIVKFLEKH